MSKSHNPHLGLALAIKACGSKAELARRIGITRGAIQQWETCPFHRAIDVERVTGVSRVILCPSFFDVPGGQTCDHDPLSDHERDRIPAHVESFHKDSSGLECGGNNQNAACDTNAHPASHNQQGHQP